MFALTNVRIATLFSLSALAVSTGCSADEQAPGENDKAKVEAFLAQDAHEVTALEVDSNGGYNFDVELASGKLVIMIAAHDQSPLVAPLTFQPSSMWTFVGRGQDFRIGQVELEQASRWITDAEIPSLCSSRRLDSLAMVTFADGSQHQVDVGINYVPDKTKRIDVSNGGCPAPSGGRANCDGKACSLGISIKGFEVLFHGDCQYGELKTDTPFGEIYLWRNCLCNVLITDVGTETGTDDGTGTGSGDTGGDTGTGGDTYGGGGGSGDVPTL